MLAHNNIVVHTSIRTLLGALSVIAGAPSIYCEKSQMPLLFFKNACAPNDPFFFIFPQLFLSYSASLSSSPSLFRESLLLLSSAGGPFFLLPPSSASPFASPARGGCSSSPFECVFFFHSSARCCSSVLHRGKVYCPFSCLLLLPLLLPLVIA